MFQEASRIRDHFHVQVQPTPSFRTERGDKNSCRGGLSAVEKDIPPFFLKDNIIAKPLSLLHATLKRALESLPTQFFSFCFNLLSPLRPHTEATNILTKQNWTPCRASLCTC